ncbi:MAG TPA: hypothetical protein VMF52_10140 [Steroidobacteraceae bacterium]|nr:hypothetical protein [Steroidobacteraceae bacterium]
MQKILDFANYLSPFLALFTLVFVIWRMTWAARALRAQGRPVRPAIPAGALFGEARASGHVDANLMTKLGGANNCLFVWVTREEFAIEAMFPLNLLMYSNSIDPRAHVSPKDIDSAAQIDARWVKVSYRDVAREQRTMRLRVNRPAELIAALKAVGVRVAKVAP